MPPDHQLIRRVRDGDAGAFETLYDRHAGYVLALALRLVRNREEADEILQAVFGQLWDGDVLYDERRGRFTTWLFALARSRSLDKLRAVGRGTATSEVDGEELPSGETAPGIDAYTYERIDCARRALGVLPQDQRNAIELCFFEGLTHREAADKLDQSLDTVKGLIKSAMDKMRAALRELTAGAV